MGDLTTDHVDVTLDMTRMRSPGACTRSVQAGAVKLPGLVAVARQSGARSFSASAARKSAAAETDPRWVPPDDDPMWDPWRVEVSGYALKSDPKKQGKWFPERQPSADEKALQKAIRKAEAEVKAGQGVEDIFPPETIYKQQMRNETLPVEGRAKGIPPHVTANVAEGSGAEERLMESAARAPEAGPGTTPVGSRTT
jgi:hypothetical protein